MHTPHPLETIAAAAAVAVMHDYRAELSTLALIAEVKQLLASERHANRLMCRYLADLADRIGERRDSALLAYVDEVHAAACLFDLGPRETRERVRIGRALRSLPQLEAALIAGQLSYSRVRELTRVVHPETESLWLELAQNLDMRALERRVAAAGRAALETVAPDAGAGDARAPQQRPGESAVRSSPEIEVPGTRCAPTPIDDRATRFGGTTPKRSPARARTERLPGDAMRVTFELSAQAWALLERALEGARARATTLDPDAEVSDAEALEIVARQALAGHDLDGELASLGPSLENARSDEPTRSHVGELATHLERSNDPADRLLGILAGSGRCSLDDLCHESAMSVAELQHILLLLELQGRIRCSSGWIESVATSQRATRSSAARLPGAPRPPSSRRNRPQRDAAQPNQRDPGESATHLGFESAAPRACS